MRLASRLAGVQFSLLIVSCGGNTDGTDQSAQAQTTELAAASSSGEESEVSTALTDGFVSHAELESAFFASVKCIETRGHEVSEALFDRMGNMDLTISAPSEELLAEAEIAQSECEAEHIDPLISVWLATGGPDERDLEAQNERFRQCLLNGAPGSDDRTLAELLEAADPQMAADCERISVSG